MSLAVAMKIQVVRTPSGGNKIAVYGDIGGKARALRSIFAAYERMGIIVTSADLGLSIPDLEKFALPVAPTTLGAAGRIPERRPLGPGHGGRGLRGSRGHGRRPARSSGPWAT